MGAPFFLAVEIDVIAAHESVPHRFGFFLKPNRRNYYIQFLCSTFATALGRSR
jgi:hypothetical protein